MTLEEAIEQLGYICQWDTLGPKDMYALEMVLEHLSDTFVIHKPRVNRWAIALEESGDVTLTLRDEDGKVTDRYELTAGQMALALKAIAEAAK